MVRQGPLRMRLHRSASSWGLVHQSVASAGGVHLCSAQGVASGLPDSRMVMLPTAKTGWCAQASGPIHKTQCSTRPVTAARTENSLTWKVRTERE